MSDKRDFDLDVLETFTENIYVKELVTFVNNSGSFLTDGPSELQRNEIHESEKGI